MIESTSSRVGLINGSDKRGYVHISKSVISGWDALLRLVMANLRLTVGDPDDCQSEQRRLERSRSIRSDVIKCVSALEHIHQALIAQRDHAALLEEVTRETHINFQGVCESLDGATVDSYASGEDSIPSSLHLLPNIDGFRARVAQELDGVEESHQALAIVYINVDEFPTFLEAHGRDAGDQILKAIAARLLVAIRRQDVLSRIAENEFACLILGLSQYDGLSSLAHKLLAAVMAPLKLGAIHLSVRPSIGIAMYPTGGAGADELIANAKSAMQSAKRRRFAFGFSEES